LESEKKHANDSGSQTNHVDEEGEMCVVWPKRRAFFIEAAMSKASSSSLKESLA
jgi:hypothetical protein